MKKLILVIFIICFLSGTSFATTYYVDYISGNDSNNGTDKSAAWKHAPGMSGATGNAAAYTPKAGDIFIFKGGAVWNSKALPLLITASGSSGNEIQYTVDKTWFDGVFWRRPVFDGDDVVKKLIIASNKDFIIIDNLELTNAESDYVDSFGNDPAAIELSNSDNVTIKNVYIHNIQDDTTPPCKNYGGFGISMNNSANVNIHNNIIGGAEMGIYYSVGIANFNANAQIHDNIVRDTGGGIIVALSSNGSDMDHVDIYNNKIGEFGDWWNCGNYPYHIDHIHAWARSGSTSDQITNLRIYGNEFYDVNNIYVPNSTAQVFLEYSIIEPLIFNNVFYNSRHENMILIKTATGTGQYLGSRIYNNIFDKPSISGSYNNYLIDIRDASGVEIYNNIFMNTVGSAIRMNSGSNVPSSDYNNYYNVGFIGRVGNTYYKSISEWSKYLGGMCPGADCYSNIDNPMVSSEYRLTASSPSSIIDAGMDLSAYFMTDKDGMLREASKWDLGAYEFDSGYKGDPSIPSPPSNLRIISFK